ncbi:MAG TPA: BPSS1780 family membrane protein [Burkholderiales bacterium]|nr:BPSS1780 family membrane protein [Burkholderiales bacterium]
MIQPRIVSARQGAGWLAAGWRLFRAAPFGWLAAIVTYWFAMSLVSLVPLAGGAAAIVLVPAFSLGFMSLARAVARGGPLELARLFDGFRHHWRSQAILGLAYFIAFGAVLLASSLADGGVLARWILVGERPSPEALEAEGMLGAAALAAAGYLPVMAAFWFAPPLAAWHALAPAKALFFSFFACLMNWRALLAYGALAAAVTLPLALSLGFGAPLFVALLMLVLPVLFASFYASYDDVFGYHQPE